MSEPSIIPSQLVEQTYSSRLQTEGRIGYVA